jgi:hypothetical protein
LNVSHPSAEAAVHPSARRSPARIADGSQLHVSANRSASLQIDDAGILLMTFQQNSEFVPALKRLQGVLAAGIGHNSITTGSPSGHPQFNNRIWDRASISSAHLSANFAH